MAHGHAAAKKAKAIPPAPPAQPAPLASATNPNTNTTTSKEAVKIPQVITWGKERIAALVRVALAVYKTGGVLADIVDQLRADPAFTGVAHMLDETGKTKVQIQLGQIRRRQKAEGKRALPTFKHGAGAGERKVVDLDAIETQMVEAGL